MHSKVKIFLKGNQQKPFTASFDIKKDFESDCYPAGID